MTEASLVSSRERAAVEPEECRTVTNWMKYLRTIEDAEEVFQVIKKLQVVEAALKAADMWNERKLRYARLELEALIRVVDLGESYLIKNAKKREQVIWFSQMPSAERARVLDAADGSAWRAYRAAHAEQDAARELDRDRQLIEEVRRACREQLAQTGSIDALQVGETVLGHPEIMTTNYSLGAVGVYQVVRSYATEHGLVLADTRVQQDPEIIRSWDDPGRCLYVPAIKADDSQLRAALERRIAQIAALMRSAAAIADLLRWEYPTPDPDSPPHYGGELPIWTWLFTEVKSLLATELKNAKNIEYDCEES